MRESEFRARFSEQLRRAQQMVDEDAKRFPDGGSCSLGGGIAVMCIPKRKRRARAVVLVQNPHQGDAGSNACERAIAYLRSEGADVFYNWGRMD